jgi:hypothetical protein
VLSVKVIAAALLRMPPPTQSAVLFPAMVLLITINVPELKMPPPPSQTSFIAGKNEKLAELLETVLSRRVSVAPIELKIPPPPNAQLTLFPKSCCWLSSACLRCLCRRGQESIGH